MLQLMEHLNANHNQNLSATTLAFNTEASFDEWLHTTQADNISTFLKITPHVRLFRTVTYYYCSRSGSSKYASITNEHKCRLKVHGYTKIDRTCPAHIVKQENNEGYIHVTVTYYWKHLCYTDIIRERETE